MLKKQRQVSGFKTKLKDYGTLISLKLIHFQNKRKENREVGDELKRFGKE